MKLISITLFALYASVGLADLYMHQFRGSNNRLNEQSANRQNANRLFDSQNNNRGGYNVGEMGRENGFANNQGAYATDKSVFDYDDTAWNNNNAAGNKQFEEVFVEKSTQKITWTAQHGCGNAKNNCNMVMEYTCDTHDQNQNGIFNNNNLQHVTGLRVMLKNGANTNTPNDPNNIANIENTFQNNNNDNEGRHESEEWYVFAKNRDRNENLFTADQKLQADDSTKTRQNPGGTRRGLEVPEERDYFPYWRPTPWKAVAIFHNDMEECETQMRQKSEALQPKGHCVPTMAKVDAGNNNDLNNIVNSKTKAECEGRDGAAWQTPFAPTTAGGLGLTMPPGYPICVQNNWSQVNNLGNVQATDKGGLPQSYDWVMPSLAQLKASGCFEYEAATGQKYVRMVTRFRYNMTTMDYAPYATTAACNQDKKNGVQSPVEQNPTVDVGVEMQGLRLALNTAQTGRTFQDRSHAYRVMGAPPATAQNTKMVSALNTGKLINVSVQGKRGNIVQTFPAVEYDFWPKIVEMTTDDCVAFQWTGSNTHNNGNPAGDGQAGDAGEGRGGSDRSNLIQLVDKNSTFPAPLDKGIVTDFFGTSDVFRTYNGVKVASTGTTKNAQLYFLSGGFWQKEADVGQQPGNGELNVLLNNAPASMRSMTVCPKVPGAYEFACTRNNNFSNRDQKLTINVRPRE